MLEWMISYTSDQIFELDDLDDADDAREEFANFDIEIDPEIDDPPFDTTIRNKAVQNLRIEGTTVHRRLKCDIHLTVNDVAEFQSLMQDEDWYDPNEGEYEIVSAVNYWICDTTCAPDFAEFSRESCDYDVLQITQKD